ncbi:MAG: ATPase, T2SS/T4P/T4SS family [Patulibacter sp.]
MERPTIHQADDHSGDLTLHAADGGPPPHAAAPGGGGAGPAAYDDRGVAGLHGPQPGTQPQRTPDEQAAWDEYERQLAEYERQHAAYQARVQQGDEPTGEPPASPGEVDGDGTEQPSDEWIADGITPSQGLARTAASDADAAVMLGMISAEEVEAVRLQATDAGRPVERLLVEQGLLTPEQLARAVSERHGIDQIDLSLFRIEFGASNLIDPVVAKRYEALPVQLLDDRTLIVAMADPANIIVIDDMSLMTGLDIRPLVASREDISAAISRLTRLDDVVTDDGLDDPAADDGVVDLRGGSDDAPVIKLVNQIIAQAVERGASDIHLQPGEHSVRVRYRVDGVLVDAVNVPRKLAAGVVSRTKIMASLDIAERRIPQDGRISLTIDGHKLDLRVVTLPSVYGEAIIMRILDKSNVVMDLDILGMRDQERTAFEQGFHQAYGAVLVTGPTGSGKSTTLYAALGEINTPEKNIITIEDPVEYQLPGLNQVQVNPKAGLSFAKGLRALMRADPDIIMVGEIRDRETAQIAIESALTGHLVLSTLHTNDAPSAVSRLMEMGIEPFLIASSIETVVAQRLARKLCTHCKEEVELTVEILRANGYDCDRPIAAYGPVGCPKCGGSGYKGRIGLYEVLTSSEEIRELVTARATAEEIGAAARRAGMRTLREDGLAKVESGLTSVEEVARVCGTT